LIVCEGTRTEPEYFHQKRHLDRSLIELEVSPGGTPKTFVERAVEMKRAAKRNAKSKQDQNLDYDEVWIRPQPNCRRGMTTPLLERGTSTFGWH
jgi:hypothetical protein